MSGMADLLNEGAPAPGAYETWWGISLKMDKELLELVIDAFFEQEATVAEVKKILLIMAIQPITEGALNAMQKNGGNALGLDPDNGPYFILNFNAAWNNEVDEPEFHKVIYNIIDNVKAEAQRRGLDNDFIYLNYASEYQDPISSYGAANKQRLISISKKYDPAQVFQYLQPGGFKLVRGALTQVNHEQLYTRWIEPELALDGDGYSSKRWRTKPTVDASCKVWSSDQRFV